MKKNNLDKDMMFPILEKNQLSLYQVSKKNGYHEYLEEIKARYSYTDMICNDCDYLDSHDQLLSLSSEGLVYDVLSVDTYPMVGTNDSNSRYCISISELRFYPKLYTTLDSVFSSSNGKDTIHMEPLVGYFKEKEEIDKGIFKENLNKRLQIPQMNIYEQKESIENIIQIVNNLWEFLSVELIGSYQIQEKGVELGDGISKEEYQQIQNFYYAGKGNSNAISVLKQVGLEPKHKEYNR